MLHTHQVSWKYLDREHRYVPKTKFETGPLAAKFYFRFQFWQVSSFGDLPVYDPTKIQKKIAQRAAELYAIQHFLYLRLNLHCQRHNDTVPSCRPSTAIGDPVVRCVCQSLTRLRHAKSVKRMEVLIGLLSHTRCDGHVNCPLLWSTVSSYCRSANCAVPTPQYPSIPR